MRCQRCPPLRASPPPAAAPRRRDAVSGATALLAAVSRGQAEAAAVLVAAGASPRATDSQGFCALACAARRGDSALLALLRGVEGEGSCGASGSGVSTPSGESSRSGSALAGGLRPLEMAPEAAAAAAAPVVPKKATGSSPRFSMGLGRMIRADSIKKMVMDLG